MEREREAADGRSQRLEQECLSVKEELQRVTREVEQGEEAVAARDRWAWADKEATAPLLPQ